VPKHPTNPSDASQLLSAFDAQERDDRRWFQSNPRRSLRARPMTAAERAVFWPCPVESGFAVVVGRIGQTLARTPVQFAPAVTARLAEMSDREIFVATPRGGDLSEDKADTAGRSLDRVMARAPRLPSEG